MGVSMGNFSPNFIANYLNSIRKYNPEGEFLVYGDKRIRWGQIIDRAYKLANALIKIGVKKGDKVAFMFHNTPEFVEVNIAVQVAGAVPSPMNYRFVPREVEYQGNHSDASVFLYDATWRDAVEPAALNLKNIKHFICFGEKGMDSALDYETFLETGSAIDPQIPTDTDDLAVMIYTGGTTGYPKGVMLTYGAHVDMFSNLFSMFGVRAAEADINKKIIDKISAGLPLPGINYLSFLMERKLFKKIISHPKVVDFTRERIRNFLLKPERLRFAYKKSIKYMIPSMPFFHDASYQILILAVFTGNLDFIIPDSIKFDPEKILSTIEKEKAVFMANVPTGWKKIVSHLEIEKYDLSSVKIAVNGAGAASVTLKKKIFSKFPNIIMVDMFGQTEMTPITTFRLDLSPDSLKERSVGKSIVKIKIVDDSGNEVPNGEIGEIMYKSSTIMKGYYKDEEKTNEAMEDGWFRGGDLGYLDEDGELRLVDRKKECINTGGEKVFPLEVEEVILEHPDVADVCIIGVPDEEWGSTVRAVIMAASGKKITEKERESR